MALDTAHPDELAAAIYALRRICRVSPTMAAAMVDQLCHKTNGACAGILALVPKTQPKLKTPGLRALRHADLETPPDVKAKLIRVFAYLGHDPAIAAKVREAAS